MAHAEHECKQLERLGRFEEFITTSKGWRTAIIGVVFAIVGPVITFGYLWGQLSNTVSRNNEYIWGDLTKASRENTRNVDRILEKMENLKYLVGPTGSQGERGIQGKQGEPGRNG
jgi:hypothetical protein